MMDPVGESEPTGAFLEWLSAQTDFADFDATLLAAAAFFEESFYGDTRIEETVTGRMLVLVTGGWSGCEEVIDALMKNFGLYATRWQSSHRGGKFVFSLESQPPIAR